MQNQRTSTMSTPNPLMPQGALQGASSTAKQKTVAMIFTIVALHVAVIVVVLMQGCKREDSVNYSQMTDPAMQPEYDPDDGFHSVDNPPPGSEPGAAGGGAPAAAATATAVIPPRGASSASGGRSTPVVGADTSAPAPPAETRPAEIPATPDGSVVPALVTTPAASTASTSSPPPAASEGATYTIRSGDSFYRIAKRYGISFRDIERANPSVDPNRLRIGQVVNIPGAVRAAAAPAATATTATTAASSDVASVYTVQPGDNLTKIADRHRTTVGRIKAANGLRSDRIKIGQKLNIPAP